MSWQHHFIAIKLKNIAIKCDELPLAFLAAYRGCLATKGGVADAASFPRAVRVIVRFNVRCEVSGRSRSLARSRRGRCLCVVRKSPKQIQVEEQSHHKFRQSHILLDTPCLRSPHTLERCIGPLSKNSSLANEFPATVLPEFRMCSKFYRYVRISINQFQPQRAKRGSGGKGRED